MAEEILCPFCKIAAAYPSSNEFIPESPDPERVSPNCYLILTTPSVMAFLDIMPISPGHVLVVSRKHREKLKDLSSREAAALGTWLPVVSRAVMRALGRGEGDWNIVQNNGQYSFPCGQSDAAFDSHIRRIRCASRSTRALPHNPAGRRCARDQSY